MHEGHDVGMANVLSVYVSLEWEDMKRIAYPEDFDLSDEAHPRPVIDRAVCQFNRD